MIEAYVRPIYQRIAVEPVIQLLGMKQQLSPSYFTMAGGLFGVAVPFAILLWSPWIAVLLLLISGFLDSLDGSFARYTGRSSEKGAVMDIITDRVVEFAVVFGLFLYAVNERAVVSMLIMGSVFLCITSFLVVGIFQHNKSNKGFHYSPGLIERPESFAFFIAMILLPHWFNFLGAVFSVLVLYTAFYRIYQYQTKTKR